MSVKRVDRFDPSYSANAGWYMANTSASRAPVAGSAGRAVPWTRLIRSPGMNTPSECLPAVTTTAGSSDLELALEVRRAGGDLVRARGRGCRAAST